jgi:RNA polymerase sigma-54 factor
MAGMELSVGVAQQQTLSPQMQQSLQLLHAPVAELRQLVASELAANPLLEEDSLGVDDVGGVDGAEDSDQGVSETNGSESNKFSLQDEWRDYLPQTAARPTYSADDEERRRFLFESQVSRPTLRSYILEQATGYSPEEYRLVELIAGSLEENGYLRVPVQELATIGGVSEPILEAVLKKVRDFEPPGVAAADLGDCLLLQLSRKGESNGLAARILRHHLPQLARHRYDEIARDLHVPLEDVTAAARHIASLEPNPGRPFAVADEEGVIPDLIVIPKTSGEEDEEGFLVRLNEEDLPRLRISNEYKELLAERGQNEELLLYLRDKIKGARFFLRSLQQRQQTLLAIGNEIVARQEEFFRRGASALKPLIMAQVADAVGLHVTTVSRAVSGKYMETPQGLFEMKYFFTPGFQNSDGSTVSNEMVKVAIREMVDRESTRSPLSDQDIVTELEERGLRVARRTIAKYREQLGILPSHLRKVS